MRKYVKKFFVKNIKIKKKNFDVTLRKNFTYNDIVLLNVRRILKVVVRYFC